MYISSYEQHIHETIRPAISFADEEKLQRAKASLKKEGKKIARQTAGQRETMPWKWGLQHCSRGWISLDVWLQTHNARKAQERGRAKLSNMYNHLINWNLEIAFFVSLHTCYGYMWKKTNSREHSLKERKEFSILWINVVSERVGLLLRLAPLQGHLTLKKNSTINRNFSWSSCPIGFNTFCWPFSKVQSVSKLIIWPIAFCVHSFMTDQISHWPRQR